MKFYKYSSCFNILVTFQSQYKLELKKINLEVNVIGCELEMSVTFPVPQFTHMKYGNSLIPVYLPPLGGGRELPLTRSNEINAHGCH